jgi:phenylalanyl-tRNA synthetase beta chain
VVLRPERATAILGDDIDRAEIVRSLTRFGFEVTDAAEGESLVVGVPSHRQDVQIEADLIEEVLRAHGYDRVPPEVPFHVVDAPPDAGLRGRNDVRDACVRLGLTEAITTCFMSEKVSERLGDAAGPGEPVRLSNPVNKQLPLMRTSALPALLDVVRHNSNVGEKDLRLFEIGKVFRKIGDVYSESWVLAGALTGQAERLRWDAPARQMDFFDGKGVLQALAEALHIDSPGACCYDGQLFEVGAKLTVAGEELGIFGTLSRKVLDAWELDAPVFAFEIDLDRLVALCPDHRTYREMSRFPPARRDAALVLDESVAAGDVLSEIESAGEAILADARIFDVYRGEQLGTGKKSLALSLTYMSSERTLTDAEVDEAHSRIVGRLEAKLGASLR